MTEEVYTETASMTAALRQKPSLDRILASAAVYFATSAAVRRRLDAEPGLLVIVQVPEVAWIAPMAKVLMKDFASIEEAHSASPPKRGGSYDVDAGDVARLVSAGRSVAIVTTDPDVAIPDSLRVAADLTIVVGPLTARVVRRAARQFCGLHLRALRDGDLAGLALEDVVAAIRCGALVPATLHRVRRAAKRREGLLPGLGDGPRLDDIGGLDAEVLGWARRRVEDIARITAGDRGAALESALLVGPPGTGKTMLAGAIARTAGIPMIATSIAAWFTRREGALGDVVQSMEAVVRQVELIPGPCVLFIDEIDAVPDRTVLPARGLDWWGPVVTGLLLKIDKIRTRRPAVLLIGATNLPDRLDPALVRPGRFDRRLEIRPPDEEGLLSILVSLVGEDLPRADLAEIARVGVGATGAAAKSWVEAARARARREGRSLETADLRHEVIPEDPRPTDTIRTIALHEAGHAVVAEALGQPVHRISCRSGRGTDGETAVGNLPAHPTARDIEVALAIAMGGRAADEILGQGANAGALADLDMATGLAVAARRTLGLKEKLVHQDAKVARRSLATDPDLSAEVEGDLRRALDRAREIVTERREIVEDIARRLVERRVLSGDELRAMLLGSAVDRGMKRRGHHLRGEKLRSDLTSEGELEPSGLAPRR